LTVSNPQPFALTVTSITTKVKDASAGCRAVNLSVSVFAGGLRTPAHGSATTSVQVSLAPGAPDACSGADFPLVFSGVGRRG
jgi:hypothetical protein